VVFLHFFFAEYFYLHHWRIRKQDWGVHKQAKDQAFVARGDIISRKRSNHYKPSFSNSKYVKNAKQDCRANEIQVY